MWEQMDLKMRLLIEETKHLSTSMLSPCLFMVHNTVRGGENDVSELTGWKQVRDPLLDLSNSDIETGGNDSAFVETTDEIDNDLAGTMIINEFELADVTVVLHDLQELDDDLGRGAYQHLALTALLGVGECFEGIAQD